MLARLKYALNNEDGSLFLQQIVFIAILLLIMLGLIALLINMDHVSQAKAGYSTTTGWFRTTETEGIKN